MRLATEQIQPVTVPAEPLGLRPRSFQQRLRRSLPGRLLRETPLGALGALLVAALLLVALLGPALTPYPPTQNTVGKRLSPPSTRYLAGTDNLGRDVFSRTIAGARVSVLVGFGAVAIAMLTGTAIGITSGYFGGRIDTLVQRFVDAYMAFPNLVLLMTIVSVLGAGVPQLILALGFSTGLGNSRVLRSSALAIRRNQYVEAARTLGAGNGRILLRHILPNIFAPLMVLATAGLGSVILAEASLSFLGFGVPPPNASWGNMLTGYGRSVLYLAPWMMLAPGIALTLTVFGFNVLGDALRDLLDPQLRGR
ncbi:MAG: ABC transporter permease [Dehalococcoidia bacterium]